MLDQSIVSGATSGVPTSSWRFSWEPSGTSRGFPLKTLPLTIAVTLPLAGPTWSGPRGCPHSSENSPSVYVRWTGDLMWMMPSAACVCS